MSYGERDPLTGDDPHALLFGDDEYPDEHGQDAGPAQAGGYPHGGDYPQGAGYAPGSAPPAGYADPPPYAPPPGYGGPAPDPAGQGYAEPHPADGPSHARRRLHRRAYLAMTVAVVIVLAVVGWVGWDKYQTHYHPKDFSGAAGPLARIKVGSGDGADAIGATLVKAKVVGSVRAFSNAAKANPQFQSIQPGTYQLHEHLSGKAAVTELLNPAARLANDAAVFEGATVFDVEPQLAKALGVGQSAIAAAVKDVSALNLPSGYTAQNAAPSSVEGFLYPATYTFDQGTTPADALTQMITNFIAKDRATHFAAQAQAAHLTPYDALIIASIAVKEAKVGADYPKVARVILNRIAAHMPLQIDATSAYAAKLANLDPTKVIYATIDSPYNTYTHDGLPPTPIANPGGEAMNAAVHPADGTWLYYVNRDAAGDLGFYTNETDFAAAVEKCKTNHWGCG